MASIIKSNTYADFNGREILTANNDGALTTQKINYPAFEAILTSDQSMTDQVTSTLIFDTERFDTDNCYDTSTGIFTPTVAGKYFIYAGCQLRNSTSSQVNSSLIQIMLNDTTYANSSVNENQGNPVFGQQNFVSGVLDLNGSTDNIRIDAYIDVGSGSPVARAATDRRTYFGAYRIGS